MQDAQSGRDIATDFSADANGHFRLLLYSLLARLLVHLETTEELASSVTLFDQLSFLRGYQVMLQAYQPDGLPASKQVAWWDDQVASWQAQVGTFLPMRALEQMPGFDAADSRLLTLVGLVEEDIRLGTVFAALQEPLVARRPCVGLLGWLLSDPQGPALDVWPACERLLDAGLLLVENQADPRAEWLMRLPPVIWDAVRGHVGLQPAPGVTRQPAQDFPTLDDLILDDDLYRQVRRVPALVSSGQISALVLRGMTGSGRRTVLGAIARQLGLDLLLWEAETSSEEALKVLGPLATLTRALPVLRHDPNPGETVRLSPLPGYVGPVGVTLGRSGGLRGPLMERALSLTLPSPDPSARRRFWQTAGVPLTADDLDEIGERFLLTGGLIRRAAEMGYTYTVLEGRDTLTAGDVHQATRALNRQSLDTLAMHLEAVSGWVDLVAGKLIASDLKALEARCRQRERLQEHAGAGFAHNLNRGVRALFSGPSGTGKTLAARALAAELQADLYRVDLAAVVNKYIGETERNLNQVFSRAEELDVILLLDEGDALMTRRTDVRTSNDRYANLETNYLLQRLENYDGIVIITTNASQRIDTAFLRRLDVIVDFAPPEAPERWLLWQMHLPSTNQVSTQFLEEIAERCVLTGGQIRNAALHATLLALGASEAVDDVHVEAGLQREYRKSGAAYPLRSRTSPDGQMNRIHRFATRLG